MLIPRGDWTSIIPRPSTEGENTIGLTYFKNRPEVEFCTPGKPLLYAYRNPYKELEFILKENTHQTGIADINYNYALASNMEGIFVCRGRLTKCAHSSKLRVLMLLGTKEEPTDLLKQNKRFFLDEWETGLEGSQPPGTLREGMSNVHVFELIEWLSEKGYYETRNDGVYGPMLKRAIKEYQNDNDLLINGLWDDLTSHFAKEEEREYIIMPPQEPVGATLESLMGVDA